MRDIIIEKKKQQYIWMSLVLSTMSTINGCCTTYGQEESHGELLDGLKASSKDDTPNSNSMVQNPNQLMYRQEFHKAHPYPHYSTCTTMQTSLMQQKEPKT